MVAMTLRLDDELHAWLRAEAFRTRTPMAKLVAYALLEYRDRQAAEL